MNNVTVSGRVWGDVRRTDRTASFRISVYNGKGKDGQIQYFYLTVFAYADSMADSVEWVKEGMSVVVNGALDIHEHDGRYYTQVKAGMSSIGKISLSPSPLMREDSGREDIVGYTSSGPSYGRPSFRGDYAK